jgi:hypothetical protein
MKSKGCLKCLLFLATQVSYIKLRSMKIIKFTIILCDGLVALLGLAFAFAYLFRPEFMSYHAVAVHETWADVDPGFQILIIALMRVSGGGFLAISVAITMLLYQFHKQDKVWPVTAIFFIGQSILIPTLYATLLVKNHTGANPPWIAAAAAIGLLLAGWILALIRKNRIKG